MLISSHSSVDLSTVQQVGTLAWIGSQQEYSRTQLDVKHRQYQPAHGPMIEFGEPELALSAFCAFCACQPLPAQSAANGLGWGHCGCFFFSLEHREPKQVSKTLPKNKRCQNGGHDHKGERPNKGRATRENTGKSWTLARASPTQHGFGYWVHWKPKPSTHMQYFWFTVCNFTYQCTSFGSLYVTYFTYQLKVNPYPDLLNLLNIQNEFHTTIDQHLENPVCNKPSW